MKLHIFRCEMGAQSTDHGSANLAAVSPPTETEILRVSWHFVDSLRRLLSLKDKGAGSATSFRFARLAMKSDLSGPSRSIEQKGRPFHPLSGGLSTTSLRHRYHDDEIEVGDLSYRRPSPRSVSSMPAHVVSLEADPIPVGYARQRADRHLMRRQIQTLGLGSFCPAVTFAS